MHRHTTFLQMHTHAHTYTCADTKTHTQTLIHRYTHRHTLTETYSYKHTQIHIHRVYVKIVIATLFHLSGRESGVWFSLWVSKQWEQFHHGCFLPRG